VEVRFFLPKGGKLRIAIVVVSFALAPFVAAVDKVHRLVRPPKPKPKISWTLVSATVVRVKREPRVDTDTILVGVFMVLFVLYYVVNHPS